jgi:hypothetical protein
VLIEAVDAIIRQKAECSALSGAILRLPCESSSSAALTRRRMGFTVGLVLEAAISEKIASYDQPQHPE